MEKFGDRMRTIRRKKGISITGMSETVGMTKDAVLKLESGVRGKTLEKLPVIAKALGCRIDDLFPEMDEVKTDSADGFDEDGLDDLEL